MNTELVDVFARLWVTDIPTVSVGINIRIGVPASRDEHRLLAYEICKVLLHMINELKSAVKHIKVISHDR